MIKIYADQKRRYICHMRDVQKNIMGDGKE